MPTFITHAAVGLTGALALSKPGRRLPARLWLLSLVLPVLPDADVAAFALGIPYSHWLGHRGFTHSLPFALVLGAAATLLAAPPGYPLALGRRWLLLFFSLLAASHGLLDIFTDGGLGVALLSPLDDTRHFAPWTPIQVSPLSLRRFLTMKGLLVLASEALWVWLPCAALLAGIKLTRRR